MILYTPLPGEPDPYKYFTFEDPSKIFTIPSNKLSDPFAEAGKALGFFDTEASVSILIPGRIFDAFGTRHGHGGGWYDRFLSAVPRKWLRIGVCYENQLSSTPLMREIWDEPMDLLLSLR